MARGRADGCRAVVRAVLLHELQPHDLPDDHLHDQLRRRALQGWCSAARWPRGWRCAKISPQVGRAPILAAVCQHQGQYVCIGAGGGGLVAVDEWLFADDGDFKAGLLPRTGFSLACFAAPMAIYYLWNVRYVGWLVSRSASDSGRRRDERPAVRRRGQRLKILLGQPVEGFYAEREAQFRTAMADMGHQFWTSDGKLSMIGRAAMVSR